MQSNQENIKFKDLLQKLGEIEVQPLLTPVPKNLEEQKDLFLKNKKYNPQFTYSNNIDFSNQEKQLQLVSVQLDASDVSKDIQEYLKSIISYVENLINLGKSRSNDTFFKKYIEKVYSWELTTVSDFRNLKKLVEEDSEEKKMNPREVMDILNSALKERNLLNWKAVVDNTQRTSIRVNLGQRTIRIGGKAKNSNLGIQKTIIHEIDTHIIRYENSIKSGLEILIRGTLPGKISAEEGFAVFNEYNNSVLTRAELNKYINRFKLCLDKNKTFAEIFEYCLEQLNYSQEASFETAYRLKRGFCDTSAPGIHLKDSSYLKGFDQMLSQVNTDSDYKFLFSGRVSLNDRILQSKSLLDINQNIYPSWLNVMQY